MRLSLSAAAITITAVQAFKDTSPFLLFSSSLLPSSLNDASKSQLQSRTQVLDSVKSFLADCPSDIYYILTQPSLPSSELFSSSPHLKKALFNESVSTTFLIAETVGLKTSDGDDLVRYLEKSCTTKQAQSFHINDAMKERELDESIIVRANYDASSIDNEGRDQLEDRDSAFYAQVLKGLNGYKYTIIYITTPSIFINLERPPLYQAAFNELAHMDLKRDLQTRDSTYPVGEDVRPLFEKYQFLNPGLFMGIIVSLILLVILSVGVNAVSSLGVSYGAFEREMGPAAQKKNQ